MQPKVYTEFTTGKGTTGKAAPVVIANKLGYAPRVLLTRPANGTPYSANDAIGIGDAGTPANSGSAIIEFAEAGPKGGCVKIIGTDLMLYLATLPVGLGAFSLHLFDAAPAAILDNAPFVLATDADRAKFLCTLDLGVPTPNSGTVMVQKDLMKQVKLADGATSLFGVLVTANAGAFGAGDKIAVRLQINGA